MGLVRGRAAILVLSLLVFAGDSLSAQQNRPWKPGDFRGLVAGKSTRKDVVRGLGTATPKKGRLLDTYVYEGKGDFGANVIVEVRRATGVIETITERFSPNITRTQARKKYGEDFREIQYSIADCPREGVNTLAYQDPNGPIGLLVYSQQGIVLWPNEEGFDIAAALYLPKPLPSKRPVCAKR